MTTVQSPPDVQSKPEIEILDDAASPKRSLIRRVAMRPRRVFVRVHRWMSFALLAWLVVVSITGAWLVFNQALDSRLHPERHHHTSGDVGPTRALNAAQASLPKDATAYFLTFPTNARGVYRVFFSEPANNGIKDAENYGSVFVDPGSAKVNGQTYDNEGFTAWMYRGHMYLWQDRGLFGVFEPNHGWCTTAKAGVEPSGAKGVVCDVIPDGEDMVSWFAVGWLVVLFTGFYLWYWPGVRRWATVFVVKRGRGRFATNLSLHKMIGFIFFVPLVVVAFTGISFGFPNLKGWFENVTPAARGMAMWEPPESMASDPSGSRPALDADAARNLIQQRFPDRRLDGMEPPTDEKGTWKAWVDRGFSPWTREGGAGNTYVAFDQYSGELLYDGSPEDGNVFDQAWADWTFPLHTGDFVGTTSRSIWVVLALSPIALGVTGTTMWLIRRSKRRKRLIPPNAPV